MRGSFHLPCVTIVENTTSRITRRDSRSDPRFRTDDSKRLVSAVQSRPDWRPSELPIAKGGRPASLMCAVGARTGNIGWSWLLWPVLAPISHSLGTALSLISSLHAETVLLVFLELYHCDIPYKTRRSESAILFPTEERAGPWDNRSCFVHDQTCLGENHLQQFARKQGAVGRCRELLVGNGRMEPAWRLVRQHYQPIPVIDSSSCGPWVHALPPPRCTGRKPR